MTPEAQTKSNPEDLARHARITLQALSETHVILTKEAFKALIDETLETSAAHMWDLIIDSYDKAAQELSGHVSPERQRGFELGAKLLRRMRDVSVEEFDAAKEPDPAKI